MAPLLLTKHGGRPCGEAIWLVFVAQGPGERLVESICRSDFAYSLAGAANVYVSTLERLDWDTCRWGMSDLTEILAGRRK